jgi:murein DD-endopeptidase MepM/ murein hydrolase activator NlpD
MSKLRLTKCGIMKYFYLTVLFLTINAGYAEAKSSVFAAKSMSSLTDIREDSEAYGKIIGDNAHSFYTAMGKKSVPSKVKIEVLAAKAEFEDIDDVIATIEKSKLPAPSATKKISSNEDKLLAFLDKKNATQSNDITAQAASTSPQPPITTEQEYSKTAAKVEESLDSSGDALVSYVKQEVIAQRPAISDEDDDNLAAIIAEDMEWEENWKEIATINPERDDAAFDKLLDESFAFLPGQEVPVLDDEAGSKAAKMISNADIERLFGIEDEGGDVAVIPEIGGLDYADDGSWQWPVDLSARQRISSKFGPRIHPVTHRRSFHQGVDIAAALGTKVMASRAGVVEKVVRHRNLGKYVMIRHSDNSYALYGHLSSWNVKKGMRVAAGQMIGKVGSTGRSTGPHLDFSIRVAEKAVDPLKRLSVPRALASR